MALYCRFGVFDEMGCIMNVGSTTGGGHGSGDGKQALACSQERIQQGRASCSQTHFRFSFGSTIGLVCAWTFERRPQRERASRLLRGCFEVASEKAVRLSVQAEVPDTPDDPGYSATLRISLLYVLCSDGLGAWLFLTELISGQVRQVMFRLLTCTMHRAEKGGQLSELLNCKKRV